VSIHYKKPFNADRESNLKGFLIFNNVTMSVEEIKQAFVNNTDCYADTWIPDHSTNSDELQMTEGPVIPAMTQEKFIEVVKGFSVKPVVEDVYTKSLAALDKLLKEMPKEELQAMIGKHQANDPNGITLGEYFALMSGQNVKYVETKMVAPITSDEEFERLCNAASDHALRERIEKNKGETITGVEEAAIQYWEKHPYLDMDSCCEIFTDGAKWQAEQATV
jgi:hypothetical protein